VQALVWAVSKRHQGSKRPFLRLFHLHCDTEYLPVNVNDECLSSPQRQRVLLFHAIGKFKEKHAKTFFAGLRQLVDAVLENEEHVPDSAFVPDEQDQQQDGEIFPDAASAAGLSFLQYAALCISTYFQKQFICKCHDSLHLSTALYEAKLALHNCIDDLRDPSWGPESVRAHDAIVSLCATWWKLNGDHREQLIASTWSPWLKPPCKAAARNLLRTCTVFAQHSLQLILKILEMMHFSSCCYNLPHLHTVWILKRGDSCCIS